MSRSDNSYQTEPEAEVGALQDRIIFICIIIYHEVNALPTNDWELSIFLLSFYYSDNIYGHREGSKVWIMRY